MAADSEIRVPLKCVLFCVFSMVEHRDQRSLKPCVTQTLTWEKLSWRGPLGVQLFFLGWGSVHGHHNTGSVVLS